MIHVSKIAKALDNDSSFDIIDELKKRGEWRKNVDSLKTCNKREREAYSKLLEEHRNRFGKDEVWTDALMRMIRYKDPHFASISNLKFIDTKDLYVTANFIGCGR